MIPKLLTDIFHEVELNHGTVLSTNIIIEAVKLTPLLQQTKSAVSFKVHQSSRSDKSKETLPSYHSWIGDLRAQPSALASINNPKPPFCAHSTRDSLPKLHPQKFDGDPLR